LSENLRRASGAPQVSTGEMMSMQNGLAGIARLTRLIAFAMLVLVSSAAAATAHASLNATSPDDGAVLETAPSSFSLTFSEPVSPLSLRLVGPDGSSISLDSFVIEDRTLKIEAPSGLARGTHALSWRIVSEDGHPVGGSVVFSIGEASPQAPLVVDEPDRTVGGGLWLSKIALYVGLFAGVGGVFARRIVMPGVRAGSRVTVLAIMVGAAGAVLSLGFQGLDALGAQAGRIVEPIVWLAGLGTSYGRTVAASMAALAVAAAGSGVQGRAGQVLATLALVAAGLALALSGHASTAAPQWLMRPMVFLHAIGIAVWIGALAPLGLALRRGEAAALTALRRFSHVIPAVVAILAIAGTGLAAIQVERPSALFDTAYGQLLLVKLALLVGLFILAAINRRWLTAPVEAGDPSATRRLVRSIAVETAIVLLIFGAVAAWRFTPPPRVLIAQTSLPVEAHIHGEKTMVGLWIGPGRAGPVTIVANLLTSDFKPLDPKEVSVVFSNAAAGIEPFKRVLRRGSAGEWRAEDVTIPLPGLWRVRVDVLVSDFDIDRLDGEVKIRP